MIITGENYFDKDIENAFFGSSQYKNFLKCPAEAVAKLSGEYEEEKKDALLVGGYVDAHFEGTLDTYKIKNPQIFTQKGALKANFKHADYVIERIERDEMMMKFLDGEKQTIKTGNIEGVDFKIKMDSYFPNKAIVDLKVMRGIEPLWKNGVKLNFIEYWGYDIQGAIYQHIEGNKLPFYIVVATKEPEPNILIIQIPQHRLDAQMNIIKSRIKSYKAMKDGKEPLTRCEKCNYCRMTRTAKLISYDDLDEYIGGVLG